MPSMTGGTRDSGWIPGLERSPGVGNGNLLHYSCLGNPLDREAWQATVCGVAESLEQEMATHFSFLAWEIPWMEEPSTLQSVELPKSWTGLSN